MFLHSFPDLTWLKKQAEENFRDGRSLHGDPLPNKGWPNVILNVTTRQTHRDNIRGPLSIFMNRRGESTIEVNGRATRIRNGFFYISNQGQHYTLNIDGKKETETFNIHFGEHLVDQVWQACTAKNDRLLEDHFQIPSHPICFHNRLFIPSEAFQSKVVELNEHLSPLALEEKLAELVEIVFQEEMNLRRIVDRVPVVKSSTRKEIISRLTRATDFMYANLDRDVSLEEISAESCLSKFHFLRLFKTVFSRTPGKYLDELRVKHAVGQILHTNLDIQVIASNLGYKNASSFSRMFHQHTGVYPSQLRKG